MTAVVAESLLDGLNPQQRAAVLHEGSPLLIVAGAGSGKTRVLTHRIAYLLAERDVAPSEILAITFTNKAAGEMAARAASLTGARARSMWLMTFHSACVRILRREARRFGYPSSFSIYDQADSQRLMALVCRELELDAKYFPPKGMINQVSNLKNELIDYETVLAKASGYREKALGEAYAEYQRRLVAAGAMDFDDLIMVTVNLLQAFPDLAAEYHKRFRHVLVDEYQDTNHAQYTLVRELAGAGGESPAELVVVGDADQSIYAFRGATIRNIEEFERDFAGARVILLEQNYRSTQNILAAANAVVSRNPGRIPKNLWSDAGDGPPITGYVADSEHDEAAFVAEEVDRLADAGEAPPGEVAVFYRTNAQSRVFEEVFIRSGLPYKVVGGVRFYERREVRDLLAYLRLVANPGDEVSLRRVLNTPRRGIGDRAEECVAALASRDRISFAAALARPDDVPGLAARSARAIEGFNELIGSLREMAEAGSPAGDLAEAVLDRTGYVAELQASSDLQDASRIENLTELVSVAREFDARNPGGTLAEFLEQVSLVADADQIPDGRGSRRHGHADDPAHGQGPGVPGGVPDRAGGKRVPARALHGRRAGAGRGAAACLRRHHQGDGAAVRHQGGDPYLVRPAGLSPAVPVPDRDPGRADRVAPGRVGGDAACLGAAGPAARRARDRQPAGSVAAARRPGEPRLLRARHRAVGRGSRRRPGSEDRLWRRLRHQAPGAAVRADREAVAARPGACRAGA